MELKSHLGIIRSLRTVGSNRTFMELKCTRNRPPMAHTARSNRTFMELKLNITTVNMS